MSNSDEQQEIELMTASLDHAIDMGQAWLRLQKNKDFKKIITEGYLRDKVLASVSLLGVPQIQEQGKRSYIMEDLVSASNLQYFFRLIEHQYEGASNPIMSDDEEAEFAAMAAAAQNESVN